jgi:hypothetical protein
MSFRANNSEAGRAQVAQHRQIWCELAAIFHKLDKPDEQRVLCLLYEILGHHRQTLRDARAIAERWVGVSRDVARPGRDSDRAEALLARTQKEGVEVLTTLARQAVERLLASGKPQEAKTLFNATERRILARQLEMTLAPGELLGRARIRLRQEQALDLSEETADVYWLTCRMIEKFRAYKSQRDRKPARKTIEKYAEIAAMRASKKAITIANHLGISERTVRRAVQRHQQRTGQTGHD